MVYTGDSARVCVLMENFQNFATTFIPLLPLLPCHPKEGLGKQFFSLFCVVIKKDCKLIRYIENITQIGIPYLSWREVHTSVWGNWVQLPGIQGRDCLVNSQKPSTVQLEESSLKCSLFVRLPSRPCLPHTTSALPHTAVEMPHLFTPWQ